MMSRKLEIQETQDGSNTLYLPDMDEHYHSVKGALTESRHIFIDMGLRHCEIRNPKVLEIGFGTGLNAFLTLLEAEETQRSVHYTTLELYPLDMDLIRQLGYPSEINELHASWYYALHEAKWNGTVSVTPHFQLLKQQADYTAFPFSELYDVIYFDAFAPEKQPEMWSQELFDRLYAHTAPGGILTTYCAKGVVRRMLQSAGYQVERLAGPPGGKREILRAIRL